MCSVDAFRVSVSDQGPPSRPSPNLFLSPRCARGARRLKRFGNQPGCLSPDSRCSASGMTELGRLFHKIDLNYSPSLQPVST